MRILVSKSDRSEGVMGSCEHFVDPRRDSPSVVVASESKGLVREEPSFGSRQMVVLSESAGLVGEEPSFDLRPMVVASKPEGLVREEPSFALQPMVVMTESEGLVCEDASGIGTLKVGGADLADGFVAPVDGVSSSDMAVEKASLECGGGDGSDVVVSESLGERLRDLVMEPLSSLDIGSVAPSAGGDSVVVSVSKQDHCLGLGIDVSASREQDVSCMDGCLIADTVKRNSDQISERPGLRCGTSDDSLEVENVSSIVHGFGKICFDGTHSRSEVSTFLTNATGVEQVASGRLQVAGISNGSTVLTEDRNKQVSVSPVKIVSDFKHGGVVDDGSFKRLIMFDKSRADCEENENGKTDDDTSQLNFFDESLYLRRSSRSKKTVQRVQKGKRVSKCSQKAANLPASPEFLGEVRRKKRSCMSRPVCSSVWGLSENLSKHFEWSQESTVNQVLIGRKTKKKPGQRSRKKNTTDKAAKLQLSEQSHGTPRRPIRLKVTFGKKVLRTKVDNMPIEGQLGLDALTSAQPVNFEPQPHLVSSMESKSGNLTGDLAPKEMLKLGCNSSMSNALIGGTYLDTSST